MSTGEQVLVVVALALLWHGGLVGAGGVGQQV